MLPSHHDLTYFQELASMLNVSRAAERLGISQPSLSMSLKRLEDSIGAPLFVRSKSGLQLTRAGEALAQSSKELLRSWAGLKSAALNRSQELSGRYTLGCHASVGRYTLPLFVPKLFKDYPGIELELQHDLSRRIAEGVISHHLDLGIVVNPVRHPDLVIRKLLLDRVTFWSRTGELSDTLIYEPSLWQSQSVLKKLTARGVSFRRLIPSPSLEVITELASAGAGTAILPARVANSAGAALKECGSVPHFEDQICMIYRKDQPDSAALKVIRRMIQERVR